MSRVVHWYTPITANAIAIATSSPRSHTTARGFHGSLDSDTVSSPNGR
jgi:hypothetical protein